MIQTITLQGFKSFAERTRLELTGGVCAVIGPNGSGKSNVVEAIRWVTHGARARELRAGRGSELIFHGSGGKAPLGLAEVQLELVTPAGERLNLSRRVYRDGEAEQDLGGRPVRARDIQAALRGTGLGPGGLAVIGQGEVSGVVQAEGRALLGSLQEAAGLSASVSVRQETAARLQVAETELGKLRLLLGGREENLETLGRAAARAREFAALSARAALLEDALEREKQLALRRELASARVELGSGEGRARTLAAALRTAAQEVEEARGALTQAQARRDAYAGALETLAAARAALAQAERYRDHLTQEEAALRRDLEALPTEPPSEPAPDLAALKAAADQARATAEAAQRELSDQDRAARQIRERLSREAQETARQGARAATLTAERDRAAQALAAAREAEAQATEALAQASAEREQAEAGHEERAQARERTLAEGARLRAELGRLGAEASALGRERDRLEAALNSYARYGEGARNALRLDHPGIVGSVADLLSVPAEYEQALTAALGRRLEQVVVQTADDAREIIEELRRIGGRATFLPLDLLRPRPGRPGALLGEGGVIGRLADLCPTDPAVVGESVLGDTLLLDTLDTANRLARRHSQRPRLVTLGGEVLEPGGAITGGRLRDTGSAVLADGRRFQDLSAELDGLQARRSELEAALAALGEAPAADPAARQAAQQAERRAERALAEAAAGRHTLEAQVARLERELAGVGAGAGGPAPSPSLPHPTRSTPDSSAPDSPVPNSPDELEARLTSARAHAEASRAAERQSFEALAQARERAAAWQRYQEAQGRAQTLASRLQTNAEAQATQADILAGARAEVERRQGALGTLDEGEVARAGATLEATQGRYRASLNEQNGLQARLSELGLLIARREGSLSELAPGALPPGSPREWGSELTGLRRRLGEFGAVNARAEADYAEERARWEAERAEVEDAAAASRELSGHLLDLEAAEERATRHAFGEVARAFQAYSAELLGGAAELEAEEDAQGRLTGLRLAVQPRGKRTRSMALLSAGERTMAGLAFLFALNHAGGAGDGPGGLPLAVLDEVDAPLDEANIRRFTAFLTRFAERGTQFVLVTHQKATMEAATALWGVTTDQSGASRVLSIRQPGEEGWRPGGEGLGKAAR